MHAVCDLAGRMDIGQLAGVADAAPTAFGIVCRKGGLACDLRALPASSQQLGSVFLDLSEPIQLRWAIGLRRDQDNRVPAQRGDALLDLDRIPMLHDQTGGDSGFRLSVEALLEGRRSAACRDHAVVGLLLRA